MAVLKVRTSKAKINKIIDYVSNKEKTEEKLISGHNCTPENAKEEFATTKELYKKTGGIQYHHYMQSFQPGEVTAKQAHQLGQELAEKIGGDKYECYIATHVDKEHIHNHIVVNSVSFEDGKKFHSSKADLKQLKEFTNKQAEREGLSKMNFDKSAERISSEELRLRLKGVESWKEDLRQVINYSKENTNSIEEMKQYLKDNFNVETKIQNKNVKYKHPEKENFTGGKKLGDNFNKEELEKFFNTKLQEVTKADEVKRIEDLKQEEANREENLKAEENKKAEERAKQELKGKEDQAAVERSKLLHEMQNQANEYTRQEPEKQGQDNGMDRGGEKSRSKGGWSIDSERIGLAAYSEGKLIQEQMREEGRLKQSGVTGQDEGRKEQQRDKDSREIERRHSAAGIKEDERSQQKGVGKLAFERKLDGVNEVLRDIERRAGRNSEQDKPDIKRDTGENKEPERKQPDIDRDDKQRGRSFER